MYDQNLYPLQTATPNMAFRAMVKIMKGSIDRSVLFFNVTRVLTLSVTLDTWCIMSVAQTRKMVTENMRGMFMGNNIRPLNPAFHFYWRLEAPQF